MRWVRLGSREGWGLFLSKAGMEQLLVRLKTIFEFKFIVANMPSYFRTILQPLFQKSVTPSHKNISLICHPSTQLSLLFQHLDIIEQRMHQQTMMSMPLQTLLSTFSPLNHYIPENSEDSFMTELPLQARNNPFQPQKIDRNRIPTTTSVQSLSKWAFTETSTQDNKQEQFMAPLHSQLPKGQIITEATFKPHELKEELRLARASSSKKSSRNHCNEHRGLKRILSNALINDRVSSKAKKEERNVATSRQQKKTKYQQLLDEVFKTQKPSGKCHTVLKNIPGIKDKYNQQIDERQVISKCLQLNQTGKTQLSSQLQSQRGTNLVKEVQNNKYEETIKENRRNNGKTLLKTFSSSSLTHQRRISSSVQTKQGKGRTGGGWTKMSFQERQSRAIESRCQKAREGLRRNQQNETKGCTFHPSTKPYKPQRKEETVSSYAKLYLDKIKKRA